MKQLSFDTEMTYNQSVARNLAHMGSVSSDWRALDFTMVDTTDKNGKAVKMPQFDFPTGYSPAPTLYPQQNSGNMSCELCSHSGLKYAYYIVNDDKKWIMLVGSECITHFGEGKSGARIGKEQVWEENRQFLRDARNLIKHIRQTHGDTDNGRVYYRTNRVASDVSYLLWLIGKIRADDYQPKKAWLPVQKAATNAVISRWIGGKPELNKDKPDYGKTRKEIILEYMEKYQ